MNADSVYIVNRFAQQGTLKVQMTNLPDTVNVAVTNDSIYSNIIMHVDSLNANLARFTNSSLDVNTLNPSFGIVVHWGLPLIIALIAMAAPLLLTNISGLDQKYHSTRILDVFKRTWQYQTLKYTGIITAICVIINFTMWQNSTCQISTIIVSFILLISILALCVELLLFYNYSGLISDLIKKHRCHWVSKSQRTRIYYALIDCAKYAIRQSDNKSMQEILTFFEEDYHNNKAPEHRKDIRGFILETTDVLCLKNKTNIVYQGINGKYTLPLSIIIPTDQDAYQKITLDSNALTIIWDTLLLYLSYNKEELILSYWENAQEYYDHLGYDYSNLDNFIAFNEKVGALLLAYGRYELLKSIIYWTEKDKKRNIFNIFHTTIFRPNEKLISLDPSEIMLRYIRLMNDIDIDDTELKIPHVSATADMKNPLKESAIGYMALLYLLTCPKGEETTYFYYEDGEDLRLPQKSDIETIRKQTNDLVELANKLLKNEELKSVFSQLQDLDNVTSPNQFVEAVEENLKTQIRIADILPDVYTKLDNLLIEETERTLGKYIISKADKVTKLKQIYKEVGWTSIVVKADINKKEPNVSALNEVKTRLFCSIIDGQYGAVGKLEKIQNIKVSQQQFIDSLDNRLKQIRNKNNYIIVCNDCRGEDIFKDNDNLIDKKYKGVQIYFQPIYKNASNVCHFALLKKEYLPLYRIEEIDNTQNILGYKFKEINDSYHQQRLVLDVGRTPDEIYKQLERQIQPQLLPKGKKLSDILVIAGYLPIGYYAKSKAVIDVEWIVNDVPKYVERDYYESEDDYYAQPDDPIADAIITPEEHNKYLK